MRFLEQTCRGLSVRKAKVQIAQNACNVTRCPSFSFSLISKTWKELGRLRKSTANLKIIDVMRTFSSFDVQIICTGIATISYLVLRYSTRWIDFSKYHKNLRKFCSPSRCNNQFEISFPRNMNHNTRTADVFRKLLPIIGSFILVLLLNRKKDV